MLTSKYRYLIPNAITFASLACGVISIFLAASGDLFPAGVLILVCYILDLLDGAAARKFNASTEFGLQLDSLVDVVVFGVAPAALMFAHLRSENAMNFFAWVAIVAFVLAGAFRLARFNTMPAKEDGSNDSIGLTITTAGATAALSVLADIHYPTETFHDAVFIPFMLLSALLMVSQIKYPSFKGVVMGKKRSLPKTFLLYSTVAVLLTQLPFIIAWFTFNSGYLGFGITRASMRKLFA